MRLTRVCRVFDGPIAGKWFIANLTWVWGKFDEPVAAKVFVADLTRPCIFNRIVQNALFLQDSNPWPHLTQSIHVTNCRITVYCQFDASLTWVSRTYCCKIVCQFDVSLTDIAGKRFTTDFTRVWQTCCWKTIYYQFHASLTDVLLENGLLPIWREFDGPVAGKRCTANLTRVWRTCCCKCCCCRFDASLTDLLLQMLLLPIWREFDAT
jgi:hypothetical protein